MPKEPQALRILIYERYWDEADTDRDADTNRAGLDGTALTGLDCIQYGTINMEDDVCKRTRQEAQVNLAGGQGEK